MRVSMTISKPITDNSDNPLQKEVAFKYDIIRWGQRARPAIAIDDNFAPGIM